MKQYYGKTLYLQTWQPRGNEPIPWKTQSANLTQEKTLYSYLNMPIFIKEIKLIINFPNRKH